MLSVKRFEADLYNANTYALSHPASDAVWLIDAGCVNPILKQIEPQKKVKALFLTHAHFDHILEINELINKYPECRIYGSEGCLQNLRSSKANLSWYHNIPVELQRGDVQILRDGDTISLSDNLNLKAISTPGHTPGSMTYLIDNYLFSGDAYIPFIKTVTKLKGGNKSHASESIKKINLLADSNTIIAAGHGPVYDVQNSDLHQYKC